MRITAAVIMRNEAVLIASKIAACATWADEIVVVDQHSEDGSKFIAEEVLRLLAIEHRVETMRGPGLGKSLSYAQAFEMATGDWVINTDVDETLVAPRGLKAALDKVPEACAAVATFRWHAVANGDAYFKVEEFDRKRCRFLRKPGAIVLELTTSHYGKWAHRVEPVAPECEEPRYDVPIEDAFLMEFKAPHEHYADQLFYAAIRGKNELRQCEEAFSRDELRVGRSLFEARHGQWSPRGRKKSSLFRRLRGVLGSD
jgi:glycosyltransferase involved in cell wall biosynthesis